MDIRSLNAQKGELLQRLDAIDKAVEASESKRMTPEQRDEYKATLEQVEAVNEDLATLTRRQEAERAQQKTPIERGAKVAGAWLGEVDKDDTLAQFGSLNPAPIVYKGFEGYGLTEEQRIKSAFGQQLIDCYRAVTGHGASPELLQIQAAAIGAGEKIGADGGFLVQTDVGGLLTTMVMTDTALLSRVRQVPLGPNSNGITFQAVDQTSRADGSRWGGVRGYWVDEGTAATATNPTYRKVELKLNKVACLGYATEELMQDAVALGSIMFDAFVDELRFLVQDAFVNGTGAGQPLGIIGAPATIDVAAESGQTATTIVSENLSNMWARCHTRAKAGAIWTVHTDCNPELDNLYITGASSDFNPRFVSYDATGATRIKGRTVVETEFNQTLGTSGDIILADWGQYLFASKVMQMAESMHVRFTTDERAFRVTWRVDGRPAWISALTPNNGTNTTSPYLTLATRS